MQFFVAKTIFDLDTERKIFSCSGTMVGIFRVGKEEEEGRDSCCSSQDKQDREGAFHQLPFLLFPPSPHFRNAFFFFLSLHTYTYAQGETLRHFQLSSSLLPMAAAAAAMPQHRRLKKDSEEGFSFSSSSSSSSSHVFFFFFLFRQGGALTTAG